MSRLLALASWVLLFRTQGPIRVPREGIPSESTQKWQLLFGTILERFLMFVGIEGGKSDSDQFGGEWLHKGTRSGSFMQFGTNTVTCRAEDIFWDLFRLKCQKGWH